MDFPPRNFGLPPFASNGFEPSRDAADFLTRPPMPYENKEMFGSAERKMPNLPTVPKAYDGLLPSAQQKEISPMVPQEKLALVPNIPTFPTKDDDFSFDVDDLVKKIDAKIAQLEEEERRNKEAAEKQAKEKQEIKPIESLQNLSSPVEKEKDVVENKEVNGPLTNNVLKEIKNADIELSDDNDDDDFFDDFFDN